MKTSRAAIDLRDATFDDIPFIMSCERRPGYDQFVGRWAEEKHRAAMTDTAFHYFIASEGGDPRGFAILHQSDIHPQNLYLKRITMHDAGRGHGRAFLSAIHDWIFANTDTHRFWLEVAQNNARGQHLYESLGFVTEGVVREAWSGPNGTRNSGLQMSLLKPDWQARRA